MSLLGSRSCATVAAATHRGHRCSRRHVGRVGGAAGMVGAGSGAHAGAIAGHLVPDEAHLLRRRRRRRPPARPSAPASTTWPVTGTDVATPRSVSCGTPTFCAVVDSGWRAVSYTNGSWGARVAPSGGSATAINAVSCTSASFCLSGSGYTTTPRTLDGGAAWEIQNNSGVDYQGQINAVSCAAGADATTGFCVVVDSSNAAFVSSNGGVTFLPGEFSDGVIAGASGPASMCLHVVDRLRRHRQRGQGLLLPWRGARWRGLDRRQRRPRPPAHVRLVRAGLARHRDLLRRGGLRRLPDRDRRRRGHVDRAFPDHRHHGDATAARGLVPHGVLLRRDGQRRQRVRGGAAAAARELRRGTHGRERAGPGRPGLRRCAARTPASSGRAPPPPVGHRWQTGVPASGIWADVAGANAPTYTPVAVDAGTLLAASRRRRTVAARPTPTAPPPPPVLAAASPPPLVVDPPSDDAPTGETPGPGGAPVVTLPVAVRVRTRVSSTRVGRERVVPLHGLGRAGTPGHAVRDPASHQRRMDDGRGRRHGRRGDDLFRLQPARPDAPDVALPGLRGVDRRQLRVRRSSRKLM